MKFRAVQIRLRWATSNGLKSPSRQVVRVFRIQSDATLDIEAEASCLERDFASNHDGKRKLK